MNPPDELAAVLFAHEGHVLRCETWARSELPVADGFQCQPYRLAARALAAEERLARLAAEVPAYFVDYSLSTYAYDGLYEDQDE